jgi:hypothetical protein
MAGHNNPQIIPTFELCHYSLRDTFCALACSVEGEMGHKFHFTFKNFSPWQKFKSSDMREKQDFKERR